MSVWHELSPPWLPVASGPGVDVDSKAQKQRAGFGSARKKAHHSNPWSQSDKTTRIKTRKICNSRVLPVRLLIPAHTEPVFSVPNSAASALAQLTHESSWSALQRNSYPQSARCSGGSDHHPATEVSRVPNVLHKHGLHVLYTQRWRVAWTNRRQSRGRHQRHQHKCGRLKTKQSAVLAAVL